MTSALFTDLLCSLALLSFFLLLGTFLRAKVKLFQSLFLPASVIGGFIALILGPIVLNILPIPQDWINTYSLLPGILIVPIVAAVPLGLKFTKSGQGNYVIFPLFCIMSIIAFLQYIIGFSTNLLCQLLGTQVYPTFGWELSLGFAGGHGTAGLLGNMLSEANLPYWETAQGIATTTATFGIIGGIIIGIILINWAARNGHTAILRKPGDIPAAVRIGFEKEISKQPSIGRETTLSSSIDPFAFHTALILAACGIAYFLLNAFKAYNLPILSNISIWAYAILVMFGLWGIMCKLKLDYLVDGKVKSKISGTLTEFAVVAAIASLPVQAVLIYIVPILIMVVLGFLVTTLPFIWLCKKYLKEYWFEYVIASFGMSTGVFLTGILLLRICDPEFESPVLGNYSLAYTIISVVNFALMPIFLNTVLSYGAGGMLIMSILFTLIYWIALFVANRIIPIKTIHES